MSITELLHQGGIFMIPLLAASVVALGVVLERLVFFFSLERGGPGFTARLRQMVQAGQRSEALQWLQGLKGPVPGIAASALQNWDRGRQGIEDAMAGRARLEGHQLRKFLDVLETTVTGSPLVGLLGTITGMMGVFRTVSEKLAHNPQADTSGILAGIGEALIATATGILLAVVCLVLHNFFQSWAEAQMDASEQVAEELLLSYGAGGSPRGGDGESPPSASGRRQIVKLYPQRYRKKKPRIEIIPMVDVMFLLLVFYILSSLALSAQRGIPVQLPQAGSGQSGPSEEIVVTINAGGEFFLDKDKVEPDNLGTALTAMASTRPGGMDAVRQGSIVLNADMSVQHRLVVKAMDQLRGVGIENFAIATEPKAK